MAVSTHKNDDSEGGLALRDFFKELFLERAAMSGSSMENDCDSCDTSDVETDVSVSSDDSSSAGDGGDMNASTYHSRRRRFRRSRDSKLQPPNFTLAQDNARAFRSPKKTDSEMRVSSYHNNLSTTSSLTNSVSMHTMNSLGSRTGISRSSVYNWRNSQQKNQVSPPPRNLSRNHHRDLRWSTHGKQIPNNSRSRVKFYDFGFVNDSLHNSTTLRRKKEMLMRRNRRTNSKNLQKNSPSQSFSIRAINSAVRTVTAIPSSESSDCDTDGEEFYEDDDVDSLSSFTASVATSKGGSSHNGSSLSFRYNKPSASSMFRKGVDRTRSSGDLPRIPRRTSDDSFSEKETFEPLKGSNKDFGVPKTRKVRRSFSSDSISVSSMMAGENNYDKALRRSSDPDTVPVGRWAAIHKTVDSSLRCPSPPRRIPSTSHRSTGRNSNHSNDSSDFESDSESYGFENSFSQFHDEDASLTPTVATTDSSNKDSSSVSMSSYEKGHLKLLLPHSSMHSRLLPLSVPDSLRKLPHNSFHGTTKYTRSTRGSKHPGKSLRSYDR